MAGKVRSRRRAYNYSGSSQDSNPTQFRWCSWPRMLLLTIFTFLFAWVACTTTGGEGTTTGGEGLESAEKNLCSTCDVLGVCERCQDPCISWGQFLPLFLPLYIYIYNSKSMSIYKFLPISRYPMFVCLLRHRNGSPL